MKTPDICPLCGANKSHQRIKIETVYGGAPEQSFWQCNACNVIYLFPATNDADDKNFYEHYFDKWMAKRSGDESWSTPETQFDKLGARELPLRMPWLQKFARPGLRVLEIGSSSGFTLAALQGLGCECAGVELSHEYAEYARRIGITTYSNLQDLSISGGTQYDLVLHYYVLEHVNDPKEFLDVCLRYLAPGGSMIFEVPCAKDPLTALYKVPAFDEFYWWRAHHWYFMPDSLSYLLTQLGRNFEISLGQRYDLSNHMHWMFTGKPGGMGKYSHIFSKGTERSYSDDIINSGYGDYLIAIVS